MTTKQEEFWTSQFGQDYTDRNTFSPEELDDFYLKTFGVSQTEMNKDFLGDLEINNILEVGANSGNQLRMLRKMGYQNLYGIEIQPDAVIKAKEVAPEVDIIQGSAFDLPFKDNYFDLVFTAGVLIHINPNDLAKVMSEMHRVAKKFIMGFEYFSEDVSEINYRGHDGFLWKADYAKLFLEKFPDLALIKEKKYKYLDSDNVDCRYLLAKK